MKTLLMSGRLYSRALLLAWLISGRSVQAALDRVLLPDRMGLPAHYAQHPTRLADVLDRIVTRVSVPFAGRCLVRSMLMFAILHPDDPGLRLVLGFGESDGEQAGHAWLARGGEPFLVTDLQVLERYPVRVELP